MFFYWRKAILYALTFFIVGQKIKKTTIVRLSLEYDSHIIKDSTGPDDYIINETTVKDFLFVKAAKRTISCFVSCQSYR